MNRYLMERGERGWTSICVSVLCQWGWEPGVRGGGVESRAACWHQWEASEAGAGDISRSPLELGPAAESSPLSAGFRPSLSVYAYAFVALLIQGYLGPALCPYISILPPPPGIAASFAWPGWPRQSVAIIFPLANLSALISIILCLLRALTALTVPLSKEKERPPISPPLSLYSPKLCTATCIAYTHIHV